MVKENGYQEGIISKMSKTIATTVIATKKNHKYWRRRDQNEYTFTICWGF